ncbi:MAG: response regulator [Bdellovibrionales bacterium]|nr:response regulator [Bdellovibrionales bacterium]
MNAEKVDVKSILLVDDEEDVRALIKQHLTSSIKDINIIEAKDGSEAMAKLSYQTFHCILTDIQMPKKDGVDLIEKIKQSNLNATTPIIVVTGFPDDQLLERFSNITFVEKPFDKSVLIQLVESQLKLGKMNQRVAANVLNAFVDATESFLKQLTQLEAEFTSPLAKAPQDQLKGDIYALVEFKHVGAISKICFGIDKNLAAQIVKTIKEGNLNSNTNPLELFLSAIFKTVVSKMQEEKQNISLVKKQIVTSNEDFTIQELNSLKAIVMPIKTSLGHIYVQAMHLENTRKAAA